MGLVDYPNLHRNTGGGLGVGWNCFGNSTVQKVSNSSPILDEKCDCTIDCKKIIHCGQ